jgi:hypothetical protein
VKPEDRYAVRKGRNDSSTPCRGDKKVINRSESQLIAREQHNQVARAASKVAERKPGTAPRPKRKPRTS